MPGRESSTLRRTPMLTHRREGSMQFLSDRMDIAAFMDKLADAPQRVLMLDYDGTLAPFHLDPSQAVPYPGVLRELDAMVAAGGTRVIIVSGRPVQELLPLLPLKQRPEIWGAHGWERLRPEGALEVRVLAATAKSALHEAERISSPALAMGARLEKKPASLAVHWRGLGQTLVQSIEQWVLGAWKPLTRDRDLALLPFDGGLELRASECSKGQAVSAVIAEARPGTKFAYLGDDITDEDAFDSIKACGPGGLAVLVREKLRETAADAWIRPPRELLDFLGRWHPQPGQT